MGKGEWIFLYFGWFLLYLWTSWTTNKTSKRSNVDVGNLIRLSECEKGHWKLSKHHQKQFKVQITFLKASGFFFIFVGWFYFLTSFFQIFTFTRLLEGQWWYGSSLKAPRMWKKPFKVSKKATISRKQCRFSWRHSYALTLENWPRDKKVGR